MSKAKASTSKSNVIDRDNELKEAKAKLESSLGPSMDMYYTILKGWLRRSYDRNHFDQQSRGLLTKEQLMLHNDFIIALMNKLWASGSPFYDLSEIKNGQRYLNNTGTTNGLNVGRNLFEQPRKYANNSDEENGLEDEIISTVPKRRAEDIVFHPADLYSYAPEEDYPDSGLLCFDPSLSQPRKAAQELFLPDPGSILGRLLVAAWEQELVLIDDDVRDYIVRGVQILLKNILTAVIKTGKDFRSTGAQRFFYDVGCPYADPFLRTSIKRVPIDYKPNIASDLYRKRQYPHRNQMHATACDIGKENDESATIQVRDLYFALKDHNLIPAHSVRAIAMERVASKLRNH